MDGQTDKITKTSYICICMSFIMYMYKRKAEKLKESLNEIKKQSSFLVKENLEKINIFWMIPPLILGIVLLISYLFQNSKLYYHRVIGKSIINILFISE